MLASIGILPSSDDLIGSIRGVGGAETVFHRQIDRLQVGPRAISPFEIEVGMMDYGFQINGILGMDFLLQSGAIINLRELRLDLLTDVSEQDEELKTAVEEALPEGEETMLSLAEPWMAEGHEKGLKKGREEGRKEARKEGHDEGLKEGLRRMFLRLLERRFGAVPVDLVLRTEKLLTEQLNRLFDLAVDATSLDEIEQAMAV
jgi:hypothetical protein